jgi:hypothetical protein
MTVDEMHIEFKVGLDKTDSLNYPNFEPDEIDLWLNRAQDKFVKQRYGHDMKGENFEETQKRTDDLREVVTDATLPPTAGDFGSKPNSTTFILPDDVEVLAGGKYWFAINEECEISYIDCNGSSVTERKNVKPIQHDDYNKLINDPFNKPYRSKILRLMKGHLVELIGDDTFAITRYFLRYIKEPVRINLEILGIDDDEVEIVIEAGVDCELADHTHVEIVNLSVSMALENIGSPRYQTSMIETISQE